MFGLVLHIMNLTQRIASTAKPPRITVITVVFNGQEYIERTILSVVGQTYPNLEYIIIDGGSTDGTIDIIRKYEDKIAYWQSEKDFGIYDAMNKGLSKANGCWVNFMNAGDVFYTLDTVTEIFAAGRQRATVIYGDVEILYPDLVRTQGSGTPENLWKGMQFCHQSVFIDVAYHKAHPFNIANEISADLAFFYEAYKAKQEFHNCGRVISQVISGGVSDSQRISAILSSMDAICGKELKLLIRIFYASRVLDSLIRSIVKSLLPRSFITKVLINGGSK